MLSTALKNGILMVLIILIVHFLIKNSVQGARGAGRDTFVVSEEQPLSRRQVVQEEHVIIRPTSNLNPGQTAKAQAQQDELYKFLFATKPFDEEHAPALTDEQPSFAEPPPTFAVAAETQSQQMFRDVSGIDEGEAFYELS